MIIYSALHSDIAKGLAARLTQMTPTLAAHGIGAVLWPPFVATDNPYSMGYDPRCDLRIGQWWSSDKEILAACDFMHAHGLRVLQDWVCRQYGPAKLPILEHDPKVFPKAADCFVPPQPWDTSLKPENGSRDGMIASYLQNGQYMLHGKLQAGRWQTEVLGIDGYRLDEAGGLAPSVIRAFNESRPGWNYAEVWEGNRDTLGYYQWVIGMPVMDFPGFYAYRAIAQGAPLTTLVGAAYSDYLPQHGIRFVESFDTDREGSGIIANKLWCYVHALTVPAKGVLIHAADCGKYGLSKQILNAAWFASAAATGGMEYRVQEPSFLAWTRDGSGIHWSGGCVCAINSDPIHWQTRRVQTHFQPGTVLKNFAPTLGSATPVDASGCTYVTVSPNYYGDALSYVLLADEKLEGYKLPIHPIATSGTGRFDDFSKVTVSR